MTKFGYKQIYYLHIISRTYLDHSHCVISQFIRICALQKTKTDLLFHFLQIFKFH